MKISELVAALTAELIRGNDAEIGFTVPLNVQVCRDEAAFRTMWRVNNSRFVVEDVVGDRRLEVNYYADEIEFHHRVDGVMEIVLT